MKLSNLNCITNCFNWNTYVTWRGNEYELSDDDTIVSKHVGSVVICKLIVICFRLLFYKIIKIHGTCIKIIKLK